MGSCRAPLCVSLGFWAIEMMLNFDQVINQKRYPLGITNFPERAGNI
jgi:hypothetical protein